MGTSECVSVCGGGKGGSEGERPGHREPRLFLWGCRCLGLRCLESQLQAGPAQPRSASESGRIVSSPHRAEDETHRGWGAGGCGGARTRLGLERRPSSPSFFRDTLAFAPWAPSETQIYFNSLTQSPSPPSHCPQQEAKFLRLAFRVPCYLSGL